MHDFRIEANQEELEETLRILTSSVFSLESLLQETRCASNSVVKIQTPLDPHRSSQWIAFCVV